MISAEFKDGSDKRVESELRTKGVRVRAEVGAEMRSIRADLQSYIKEFKLHGGNPLHSRTGNLSRSIVGRDVVLDGDTFAAIVGVAPNATKYARIHEFGGTIHVPAVSNTLMVFTPKSGRTVFTMRHKAFTVTMPERSFMRSGLRDKQSEFKVRVKGAIARGMVE